MTDPIEYGPELLTPQLLDPESLDLPACREVLRAANELLLAQAAHIKGLTKALHGMGGDLARLVVAHRVHDAAQVVRLLNEITQQHVTFLEPGGAPAGPADPSTIH